MKFAAIKVLVGDRAKNLSEDEALATRLRICWYVVFALFAAVGVWTSLVHGAGVPTAIQPDSSMKHFFSLSRQNPSKQLSEADQKRRAETELFIFARFHARPGNETDVETALRKLLAPTRLEPGCLSIHVFRSIRDARLFYIHSRWVDEAAFNNHVSQPYTVQFVDEVQPLVDNELDTTRAKLID